MKVNQPETLNTESAQIAEPVEQMEAEAPHFYEPTEADKEILSFIVDHTDRWREYRDQNHLDI